jgi:hypothetical protein
MRDTHGVGLAWGEWDQLRQAGRDRLIPCCGRQLETGPPFFSRRLHRYPKLTTKHDELELFNRERLSAPVVACSRHRTAPSRLHIHRQRDTDMTDMTIRWRLVLNIHLRDGLPEDKAVYLQTMESIAKQILETFQASDRNEWWVSSVAAQPAPKPLMHSRDL